MPIGVYIRTKEYRENRTREKNPNWVGNKRGYNALHVRIGKLLKKPKKCVVCKKVKKLELCNISQKYLDDISDWFYGCHSCHMKHDMFPEKKRKRIIQFLKAGKNTIFKKGNKSWNTGKHCSNSTKKKLSIAIKRIWKERKANADRIH